MSGRFPLWSFLKLRLHFLAIQIDQILCLFDFQAVIWKEQRQPCSLTACHMKNYFYIYTPAYKTFGQFEKLYNLDYPIAWCVCFSKPPKKFSNDGGVGSAVHTESFHEFHYDSRFFLTFLAFGWGYQYNFLLNCDCWHYFLAFSILN